MPTIGKIVDYEPARETAANLALMKLIARQYTARPYYGNRRMTVWREGQWHAVNRKRVRRLMALMGLEAVYPRPKLSARGQGHKVFPYLLRGVTIDRVDQVWSTDITYIPLATGFLYLAAVIDWYSRYVLAWQLSNTLDGSFCLDMLDEALRRSKPEVFSTEQGVPFTDDGLFVEFGKLIVLMFQSISVAIKQNRTLAALRDTLLPKPISGELRVPDAERIVGQAT